MILPGTLAMAIGGDPATPTVQHQPQYAGFWGKNEAALGRRQHESMSGFLQRRRDLNLHGAQITMLPGRHTNHSSKLMSRRRFPGIVVSIRFVPHSVAIQRSIVLPFCTSQSCCQTEKGRSRDAVRGCIRNLHRSAAEPSYGARAQSFRLGPA